MALAEETPPTLLGMSIKFKGGTGKNCAAYQHPDVLQHQLPVRKRIALNRSGQPSITKKDGDKWSCSLNYAMKTSSKLP